MTFIDQNPKGADHMGLVMSLLNQAGGIGGLVQAFEKQGLGGVIQSWIGSGQNTPVSAQQIASVLGPEKLAAIAAKFGMDPQQAQQILATVLPQVVDKLTPQGQVHEDHFSAGNLMSLAQTIFSK